MRPYPTDTSGRVISPDGAYWWDGARWAPTGWAPGSPAPLKPYASPRLRADLAIAFLGMLIAVNVLDIVNSVVDLAAFSGSLGAGVESGNYLWTQGRNVLVGVSWLVVAFPGSVVTISLWVHRAYRNLRALGHQPATSPAMAVAWFFIPIANLWKPLGVVREIWRSMLPGTSKRFLGIWWACWLAGILLGSAQMQLSLRETNLASHTLPLLLSLASDAVWIAASLLLIKIIRAITDAQEEAAARPSTPILESEASLQPRL
jgi:hypothetical protein